jgi:Flp pilus assembly protein TadD
LALLGDNTGARAYADSARVVLEAAARAAPESPALHADLGLAYAYLGRKSDAVREGEVAVRLAPPPENTWQGPAYQQILWRIYRLVGERDKAGDLAETLLKSPALLSRGWITIAY